MFCDFCIRVYLWQNNIREVIHETMCMLEDYMAAEGN